MKKTILFAVLTLVAGCRQKSPEISFEPEARVLAKAQGRDPRMVVRASGDVFTLIARKAETGHDAVLLKSSDGGDLFTEAATLNTVPGEVLAHGETGPRLLLGPRSEFYAVWTSAQALRVSRSRDYGRTFEPPVDVPTGGAGGPSFFTAELATDGTLLVAWFGHLGGKKGPPGTSHLNLAASRDGAATFEVLPAIATNACPCCRPAIASDEQGRWYLSWRSVDGDNVRDVVASVTADRGKTWSAAAPVGVNHWKIQGCPHSGPSLLVAGSRLYAAWYSEGTGTGTAYWSSSPLGAIAFDAPTVLSEGVRDANHPALAAQGGAVWAAFQGRDGKDREGWSPAGIYVRRLAKDAPLQLAPRLAGSASYPELRPMGADRWVVAWNVLADDGARIAAARFRVLR